MASQHPCIGLWYQCESNEDVFEVVALDEYSGMIEIQYENGDLGEMEFEQWLEERCSQTSSPECTEADFGINTDDIEEQDQPLSDAHWQYNLNGSDLEGLGDFEGVAEFGKSP